MAKKKPVKKSVHKSAAKTKSSKSTLTINGRVLENPTTAQMAEAIDSLLAPIFARRNSAPTPTDVCELDLNAMAGEKTNGTSTEIHGVQSGQRMTGANQAAVDGMVAAHNAQDNEVAHPPHYNAGKIEVIEFIEDQKLGYNLGNALKYIARARLKGKPLTDLAKARWYIAREMELQNAFNLNKPPTRPNEMRA